MIASLTGRVAMAARRDDTRPATETAEGARSATRAETRFDLEAAQAAVHRVPPLRRDDRRGAASDDRRGAAHDDRRGAASDERRGAASDERRGAARDERRGAATHAGRIELGASEVSRHAVRLVVVDAAAPRLESFAALPRLLRAGDLVVVNDAATLPGSLRGRTARGEAFELRLSGPVEGGRLSGVLLDDGDHRTRTEHRRPPPVVSTGDRATIAGLAATVASTAGRRVVMVVRADEDALWQALYARGAPVQYAHRPAPLPLWSVQTGYAGRPWAAEMPSAGRPLTWDVILGLRRAGIALASLTHAAGLSSTGDDALDRALPWPERYEIPRRTAEAIAATRAAGGRVIAVGTTVVRALEAAALDAALPTHLDARCESRHADARADREVSEARRADLIRPGSGIATLRLDAGYRPRVVSGLVSGLHVPGESHFELLAAFAPVEHLRRAIALAAEHGLSSHELGDACLILPA